MDNLKQKLHTIIISD